MSWMDPHTTQKEGRQCKDCHTDSRSLGLGKGVISFSLDGLGFIPDLGRDKVMKIDHGLDAFVDIEGRSLVHTSRQGLRPFSKGEIDSILYVGFCLECHRGFSDPVMKNWSHGKKETPCQVMSPLLKEIKAQ